MTVEVQRIAAFSRPQITWCCLTLTAGLLAVASILGCGKTTVPEQASKPNAATQDLAPAESPSEPPGKMEMPANVVPDVSSEPKPKTSNGFELPKDVPLPEASSSTPTIPALQFASWEEIERKAKGTKRVTIVDVWSLSCAPCLKEFPGLVRLHKQFGENVVCIGVDVDYDGRKTRPPETYQTRVTEFLTAVGAEFENYISNTPSDDVYIAAELDSIPAVLIYDANGDLIKKFADAGDTAGFTYDKDIIPLIEKIAG